MRTDKTKDLTGIPPWLVRVSLGSDRAGDEAFRGRRASGHHLQIFYAALFIGFVIKLTLVSRVANS